MIKFRARRKPDFPFAFSVFNEAVFGLFKEVSISQWIENHILQENPGWFEDNQCRNVSRCLEKIESKGSIHPELYRTAILEAANSKREQKNIENFTLYSLIEASIVDSLCVNLFNRLLNGTINREEIKEHRTSLKEVEDEIQNNNDRCNKFIEQANNLYERCSQKQMSRGTFDSASEGLKPIEFAAFFFKSLSTQLLGSMNPNKWTVPETLKEKMPLLESCVELRKLFMIGSILVIATFYLQTRMKSLNCLNECDIELPSNEGPFAVILYNSHRLHIMTIKLY